MNFLTTLCIFIVVLFLYVYIDNQFKKSEDLEIYEMDYSSNINLQEVCDIRQPVLFNFNTVFPGFFLEASARNIAKYGSYDVRVKDAHDYYKEDKTVDAVVLSMNSAQQLFANDNASHFFSENNEEFLEESGVLRILQSMDDYLKPNFNISTKYDLLFGSKGAVSPLRYHTNYRQFFTVTSGKIHIKMSPWKNHKYLHEIKDYENFEFRSPVHPLSPKPQYSKDYEKTQFIEFDVLEGYTLYIPPYWWYSIEYSEGIDTFVIGVSYTTIMNAISNLPDLALYWLQQQNITKKITKIPQPMEPRKPIEPTINIVDNTHYPLPASHLQNIHKEMLVPISTKEVADPAILTDNSASNIEPLITEGGVGFPDKI
jgi:hypothetical protein